VIAAFWSGGLSEGTDSAMAGEYFQRALAGMAQSAQTEINIIDAETGKTLASTATSDMLNMPVYVNSVIISALNGKEAFMSGRKSEDLNGRQLTWMEYARPVAIDGGGAYVVYARMDASGVLRSLSRTTGTISLSIGLAIALSAFIGVLFAGTLTVPIAALTRKAKELAGGGGYQEIAVNSKDEIGQLTQSFNDMARDLNLSMSNMENEKNKLEIVLYNMTDGVLAYDASGSLIHANAVSREMLNIYELETVPLADMARILSGGAKTPGDLNEAWKGGTLTVGDKFIETGFNPYRNKDGRLEGVVIVLQDITRHKKLDDMRKEFVANVSHEIRTPLTTIKSYAETLLDDGVDNPETARDFLSVINSETDRMTLIAHDLLELSNFDNNRLVLNRERVSLAELVRQSVKAHSLTAEKRGQTLIFDEPKSDMETDIDAPRVSQALYNIISNAMKYSHDGAKIKVYARESAKFLDVFVKDDGIGIPKEDLARIFERFYRVDKARSRALGGTGLGLSIASEIMKAHGGEIKASSELSEGTTMLLRFPRAADA
jgi:two-component system sensor histidine kinase VicK